MAEKLSHAAAERAAAKHTLKNGGFTERETYTAKQVAMRCGTDAKTMRKFFRSNYSTVEPVGQGGRYDFAASDLPKIKREFAAWLNRSTVKKRTSSTPTSKNPGVHGKGLGTRLPNDGDYSDIELEVVKFLHQEEPTEEDLATLEVVADLTMKDLED